MKIKKWKIYWGLYAFIHFIFLPVSIVIGFVLGGIDTFVDKKLPYKFFEFISIPKIRNTILKLKREEEKFV